MEDNGTELVPMTTLEGRNGLLSEASDNDSGSELISKETPTPAADKSFNDFFNQKIKSLLQKHKKKPVDGADDQNALKKELTLFSGVGYVVGIIIGSGIFITPKRILCLTGSFGLSLIVWIIGGLVAMAGGVCYIELGLLIKKSGAEYNYLKETYSFNKKHKILDLLGSLISFLYIWSSVCIIRSTSLAIISLTCAEYLIRPFFIGCKEVPEDAVKLLTLTILLILGLMNCYSLKLASRVMSLFMVIKLLAILFIVLLGVGFMIKDRTFPDSFKHPFEPLDGKEPSVPTVALSLYGVLFAYDGWNNMNYGIEETKNPKRNLPLSIFIGVPIVILSYTLVNVAFFAVLDYDQVLSSRTVALPFGEKIIGTAGLVIVPLLVAISAFGAANGTLYSASRVVFVTAREGQFPDFLSGLHITAKTPVPAVLLTVTIASLMVVAGTIEQLIDGFSFVSFVFYTLVIVGVLILRVTRPKEPRIFKVWFIVPVAVSLTLFCLFVVFAPLLTAPIPPLIAIGFMSIGLPIFIFLVMDTPYQLRPKFVDKFCEFVCRITNNILNTRSAR